VPRRFEVAQLHLTRSHLTNEDPLISHCPGTRGPEFEFKRCHLPFPQLLPRNSRNPKITHIGESGQKCTLSRIKRETAANLWMFTRYLAVLLLESSRGRCEKRVRRREPACLRFSQDLGECLHCGRRREPVVPDVRGTSRYEKSLRELWERLDP
jgi:hypothetical protein